MHYRVCIEVQAHQVEQEGLGDTAVLLQTYLGLAWTLGCAAFGLVVVQNSVECRIARQYLCQAAVFMCGLSILALTAVHGNYHGYVMFAWIYGIFCGGYVAAARLQGLLLVILRFYCAFLQFLCAEISE